LGKWILSSLKCIAQYACVQKGQISHPKDEKDTDQRERPERKVRAVPT
jgi:predicted small lipoprotein YifL